MIVFDLACQFVTRLIWTIISIISISIPVQLARQVAQNSIPVDILLCPKNSKTLLISFEFLFILQNPFSHQQSSSFSTHYTYVNVFIILKIATKPLFRNGSQYLQRFPYFSIYSAPTTDIYTFSFSLILCICGQILHRISTWSALPFGRCSHISWFNSREKFSLEGNRK